MENRPNSGILQSLLFGGGSGGGAGTDALVVTITAQKSGTTISNATTDTDANTIIAAVNAKKPVYAYVKFGNEVYQASVLVNTQENSALVLLNTIQTISGSANVFEQDTFVILNNQPVYCYLSQYHFA